MTAKSDPLRDALTVSFEKCFAIQQRIRRRLAEGGGPGEGFPVRVHIVSFEPAPPD